MREKIKILLNFLRRLTVFDWLVVFVVLFGLVFLALFVFKEEKWVEVEVKISRPEWWWETKSPPSWLVDRIEKGDEQYDNLGRKVAEVLEIKSWGSETKRTYLILNLKAEVDRRKKKLKFNHRPLEVGKPIELELGGVGAEGVVTFIEGMPDARVWEEKIVEARLIDYADVFPETLGVMPWKVEAIKIGDKMYDTQGGVVAEVLNKKVSPAEKIVKTSDGRVFVRQDPIKKDVALTLKLKTFKEKGINYFLDDTAVKVDNLVPLFLSNIDIYPVITKIVE